MKKKARKDPGIPNSLPFKEEILREVALKKQQMKLEEEQKKEAKKAARLLSRESKPKNLEDLRDDAEARTKEHEAIEKEEPNEPICNAGATSRKYYFKVCFLPDAFPTSHSTTRLTIQWIPNMRNPLIANAYLFPDCQFHSFLNRV